MIQFFPDGRGCISDLIDQHAQPFLAHAKFMAPAFSLAGVVEIDLASIRNFLLG
jgi:hypothetical protein